MRFLLRFLINAAALWVATQVVPGVEQGLRAEQASDVVGTI